MSETPQEPIQLKTTKILKTLFGAVMQQHGCLVEEGSVTLPIGSTRTLRRPAPQPETFWYDMVLPDRFQLLEAHNQHAYGQRGGRNNGRRTAQ